MKFCSVCVLLLLSASVKAQKSDSVSIARLIIADYKTMGTWNIQKHIENCTNNYTLIENGEVWNLQMESDYFAKNAHREIDRKDNFIFNFIRITGNIGYAVYDLKSDITEKGNIKKYHWTESAIFRKVNGTWKIELIHSTPVEKK